jgi:hypothetical protein
MTCALKDYLTKSTSQAFACVGALRLALDASLATKKFAPPNFLVCFDENRLFIVLTFGQLF